MGTVIERMCMVWYRNESCSEAVTEHATPVGSLAAHLQLLVGLGLASSGSVLASLVGVLGLVGSGSLAGGSSIVLLDVLVSGILAVGTSSSLLSCGSSLGGDSGRGFRLISDGLDGDLAIVGSAAGSTSRCSSRAGGLSGGSRSSGRASHAGRGARVGVSALLAAAELSTAELAAELATTELASEATLVAGFASFSSGSGSDSHRDGLRNLNL
jgi:hypothetical protein